MARKNMRVLSPFLVIAVVLSLVAGVIVVSPQTALAAGETTLLVNISAPPDGETFDVCQDFYVNADIVNNGDNPATGVSASLSVSPADQCNITSTNPINLTDPVPVGGGAGTTWNLHCEGEGDAIITVTVTADNASAITDSITITQVPPEEAYLVVNITSPLPIPPAEVVTFSVCQNFDLVFTVSNRGEAAALNVTADIDPGATAEVDSLGKGVHHTYQVGDILGGSTAGPFTVVMHCVEAGPSTITVTPAGTDENSNLPIPGTNLQSDSVTVDQELKAHLVVEITEPYDDPLTPGPETIYSTCQDFTVSATVTNTGQAVAEDVWATVSIAGPGAASVVVPGAGANPQYLGDLDPEIGGGSATATWTLHCDGPGDVTITVTATGTDENTHESIHLDNVEPDSITVGQEGDSITTPRGLKEDAIELLEAAKTGECWLDKKIDKIIWFIMRSLDKGLWVDDSHLKPCKGTLVFVMEKVAVLHMQRNCEMKKIPEPVKDAFQEATLCLVNADAALAQIAIEDAKDSQGDEHQIMMAEESLAKAYEELAQGSPAKAIMRFAQAWGHAQVAMK